VPTQIKPKTNKQKNKGEKKDGKKNRSYLKVPIDTSCFVQGVWI